MNDPVAAPTEGAVKKQLFAVQRLYAKDVSFEAPGAPGIFTVAWEPETNVQFGTTINRLSDTQFEVVLQLTVTTSLKGKPAYISEVKYAGVFHVDGIEGPALEHLLGVQCPTILFPYARELISDSVMRGTFPQFIMQPMNFDAIFAEAKRRREQEAADAAKH